MLTTTVGPARRRAVPTAPRPSASAPCTPRPRRAALPSSASTRSCDRFDRPGAAPPSAAAFRLAEDAEPLSPLHRSGLMMERTMRPPTRQSRSGGRGHRPRNSPSKALNARACSTGKPCAAPEMIVRSAPGMCSASSSPSAVGVRMSWLPDTTRVGTRTSTSRSRSESSTSRIARACAANAWAGTFRRAGRARRGPASSDAASEDRRATASTAG